MSDAYNLAIFGAAAIFKAHRRAQQARTWLGTQIQKRMSDYTNGMICEEKKIHS